MSLANPSRNAETGDPGQPGGAPVLLFDGVCNLCSAYVRFVIEHDPKGRVFLCSLQSPVARELLLTGGMTEARIERLTTESSDGSVAFVDQGQVHLRSGAVLRLCAMLAWPWWALKFFIWVPAPIRDLAYQFVARRRYRWFGKSEQCLLPAPGLRDRFLG